MLKNKMHLGFAWRLVSFWYAYNDFNNEFKTTITFNTPFISLQWYRVIMQPPCPFPIGATFVTSIDYNESMKWSFGCLIMPHKTTFWLMTNCIINVSTF